MFFFHVSDFTFYYLFTKQQKEKKKSHFETKVKVLFRKYPRGNFIFNFLA